MSETDQEVASQQVSPQAPRVAAVVLAAGMSRRMLGPTKTVLPLGGRPLIRRIVERVLAVQDIAARIVVTGHNRTLLEDALRSDDGQPLDVRVVHNFDYEHGEMLSSIQVALESISQNPPDAVLIVLGDQPTLSSGTLRTLMRAWQHTIPRPRIVLPTFDRKHGHPILLDGSCIGEVLSLPRGATLKDFTSKHVDETLDVCVSDSAVLEDIDTPEDYDRAVRWWRELETTTTTTNQLQV